MRKYRLIAKKGEGTFSEVIKAQNIKNSKFVAIKCMRNKFKSIDQVNNLREIQALRRLMPHPNIVNLEEVLYDKPTGRLALVFELMSMNLYELIRNRKNHLNNQLVKIYCFQALRALDQMHSKGVFHRDIKPENILIESSYDVYTGLKLADFGSCRGIKSKQPYTEYISTRWYRAPECLLTDGYYGAEMDVWGIGCVFFELSALFPLFPGENEKDQMNKIHKILGTPSDSAMAFFKKHQSRHMSFSWTPQKGTGFKSLIPHVPADFRDLLEGMLQYDPRKRISAHDAVRHRYFDDLWDTPLPPELQEQGGVKAGTKASESAAAAAASPSAKKAAVSSSGDGLKVQSHSAAPVRGGLDSPESVRSEVQGGSKARPSGGGDSPVSEALGGDGKYDDEDFEESIQTGSTAAKGGGGKPSHTGTAGEATSVSTSLQLSGLHSLSGESSFGGGKSSGGAHSKHTGGGMSYLSGGRGGHTHTQTQAHRHTHGSSQAALQPLSGSSLGRSQASSKGGSTAYLESLAGSGQKRQVGIKKVTRGVKGGKSHTYTGTGSAVSGSTRSSGGGGGGASAAELAARHKQLMRKTRKGTVSSKVASKGGGSRLVHDTFTGGAAAHGGLGAIGGALGASPSAATVGGIAGGYNARSSSYDSHVQSQPNLHTGGKVNLSIGGGFGSGPKRAAGGAKYGSNVLRQGGISTGALGLARRTQGAKQGGVSGGGAAGGSPLRSSGGGSYAAMGAVRSSSGVQGFNAGAASKYFGSGGGSSGYGGGYGAAPKSSAGIGGSYHRAAGGAHRTVNLRLGAPKSSAGAGTGTLGRLSGAPGSSAGVASKYRMR